MKEYVFNEEIRFILATNGDKLYPSNDSVELIHNIFYDELLLIINKICAANELNHSDGIIKIEDIVFTLRQNKTILKRLFKWLKLRCVSLKHAYSLDLEFCDNDAINICKSSDSKEFSSTKHMKIYKDGIKYLSKLYNKEEGNDKIFEVKDFFAEDRKTRSDIVSSKLSLDDYLFFQEMKTFGFIKNKENLQKWLFQNGLCHIAFVKEGDNMLQTLSTNYIIDDILLDIIAYLGKEIVLSLVDQIYLMYYMRCKHNFKGEKMADGSRRHALSSIVGEVLEKGISVRDVKEAYRRFHFVPIAPTVITPEDVEKPGLMSILDVPRRLLLDDTDLFE